MHPYISSIADRANTGIPVLVRWKHVCSVTRTRGASLSLAFGRGLIHIRSRSVVHSSNTVIILGVCWLTFCGDTFVHTCTCIIEQRTPHHTNTHTHARNRQQQGRTRRPHTRTRVCSAQANCTPPVTAPSAGNQSTNKQRTSLLASRTPRAISEIQSPPSPWRCGMDRVAASPVRLRRASNAFTMST